MQTTSLVCHNRCLVRTRIGARQDVNKFADSEDPGFRIGIRGRRTREEDYVGGVLLLLDRTMLI
jgi:hypothetical protein